VAHGFRLATESSAGFALAACTTARIELVLQKPNFSIPIMGIFGEPY